MTPTLGSRGCGGSGQEAGVDDELAPDVPVDDVVLEPVLDEAVPEPLSLEVLDEEPFEPDDDAPAAEVPRESVR